MTAAKREQANGRTQEQVRADVAAVMDRRAAKGNPYLSLGTVGARTWPYNDAVLPAYTEQPD